MIEQRTTHIGDVSGPVHTGRGDIIIQQAPVPTPPEAEPAFRVLTIVARPLDQTALPEIGDAWSLADQLAQTRAPLELAFARPPTPETLRRRLAEDWDVVHYANLGAGRTLRQALEAALRALGPTALPPSPTCRCSRGRERTRPCAPPVAGLPRAWSASRWSA